MEELREQFEFEDFSSPFVVVRRNRTGSGPSSSSSRTAREGADLLQLRPGDEGAVPEVEGAEIMKALTTALVAGTLVVSALAKRPSAARPPPLPRLDARDV